MPNYHSGNFKQKNKAFKGSKKNKSDFKEDNRKTPKLSKKIKKEKGKEEKTKARGFQKANRKNQKNQKIQNEIIETKSFHFSKIIKESLLTRFLFGTKRKRLHSTKSQ